MKIYAYPHVMRNVRYTEEGVVRQVRNENGPTLVALENFGRGVRKQTSV